MINLKEYRIPLPLTLDEYRIGQKWTEYQLMNEMFQKDLNCSHILDHSNIEERSDIIKEKIPSSLRTKITPTTTMTHKKYTIKDQIPKFIEVLVMKSKTNLTIDEYCWDLWPHILTIIESEEYHLRLIIQSYYRNNSLNLIDTDKNVDYLYLRNEELTKEYEIINVAERLDEKDYRVDEDPTRNSSIKKPHILPLILNSKWYENWSESNSSMCVYKLIEFVPCDSQINQNSLLNRAMSKILWSSIIKLQKTLYHRFHQKLLTSIDLWFDPLNGLIIKENESTQDVASKSTNTSYNDHFFLK